MIQKDEVPQNDQLQTGESKDNFIQGLGSQEPPPSAPKSSGNYEKRKRQKPSFVVRMWRIYSRKEQRPSRDNNLEKATVFLTAVIAVCTGIQACIYWQQKGIMESSGQQTDKIIQAANTQAAAAGRIADASDRNAAAADRFAGAADGINRESQAAAGAMAEQVKKLQAGVSETHDLAKATHDAVDSSVKLAEEDRRPWVGLQFLQCNNCKSDANSVTIGDLSATLVNTGKTPAVDMIVDCTSQSIPVSMPIPSYDAIEKEREDQRKRTEYVSPHFPPEVAAEIRNREKLIEKKNAPPKEVLAPNAPRPITIMREFTMGRPLIRKPGENWNVIYGLGKVIYYDTTRTVQHTTTFCVMNEFETVFRSCPTGNDMD
jgi:hypothetical protein